MSAPSPPLATVTMRQVLAEKLFFRLWLAQAVSIFGDFLAIFAIQVAITFRMHGTAQDVSGVWVAFLLPMVFVGPVAGVFVDRWDARRTMIASDLIRAVLFVGLAFTTGLWQMYAVFFLVSTVSSFFIPAQSVSIPILVKREALVAASAIMQQTVQIVRIFSPAVASALVGWFGENSCYYADSASFVFSAAMIATLVVHRPAAAAPRGFGSVLSELASGMRFTLTHAKIAFVMISMTAGVFAMTCFSALLSVFVRDILHAGKYLFGTLGSAVGAGTIVGGAVVGKLARGRASAHLVSYGIGAVGLFVLLLTLWPHPAATVAGALGIGLGVALILIPSTALLQGETPAEMRGRVSSSSMSLIAASQGVALLFAGGLATKFGILNVFYGSAVMMFVIALAGLWWLRRSS